MAQAECEKKTTENDFGKLIVWKEILRCIVRKNVDLKSTVRGDFRNRDCGRMQLEG